MDEETKKLVKLLLEKETGETEAGRNIFDRNNADPPDPATKKPREKPGETEPEKASDSPVPVWEKYALTISEAAAYFNVSRNKIYRIIERDKKASFLIRNGKHFMIKRRLFEEFLDTREEY